MKQLLRVIDSISDWSGRICSFLVFFGIFVLAFEVVARYFFGAPTVWAHGYSQRIFGSYFVLVGAYTLFKHGHVRVDIIYWRFSLRVRAFLDLINYALLLIWSFVLIKEGWMFFLSSYEIREADEMVLAHPVYPVKFFLFVGAILITLQGLNRLFVSVFELVKGVKYES
ncbi:TRAP transporter small permease subunit [Desulfotignum phosphitoxidans]|uniref:TRAP-type C4-dicarboxylate transporter permease, small subunit DctQ n=1 Tax=Desulfotignum phosphitoxidans DSM 13687 TaxID=1286635 RepID=S0G779_9BACT|nr:TRAP transporter small permease subunit [Desulfotignum phosphitoxidans]EMS80937.1 TRAP-type C4-dicarboxylate transporter permease, small subunit DctQ [Desulfotignum phosphitoxidans DSM 13687]